MITSEYTPLFHLIFRCLGDRGLMLANAFRRRRPKRLNISKVCIICIKVAWGTRTVHATISPSLQMIKLTASRSSFLVKDVIEYSGKFLSQYGYRLGIYLGKDKPLDSPASYSARSLVGKLWLDRSPRPFRVYRASKTLKKGGIRGHGA